MIHYVPTCCDVCQEIDCECSIGTEGSKKQLEMKVSMVKRTDAIDLLETYSVWLEKQGYMDGDWRHEPPYAIDEFLKTVDN